MIKTPYDTTICKPYMIGDIVEQLKILYISGTLQPSTIKPTLQREQVMLLADKAVRNVGAFTHPILIEVGDKEIFVLDARGHITENRTTGELRPSKSLLFQDMRACLMLHGWLEGDGHMLLNAGDIQMKVFARLMADNLTQRLNLDDSVKSFIQVTAAFYYYCLHIEQDKFDDLERNKAVRMAGNVTGYPANDVAELLNDVPYLGNLREYAEYISNTGPGNRISRVTLAWFYDNSLGGIWMEHNAKELVAVALEHPPTFATILYQAANDKSYRNTILSKVLELSDRRRSDTDFFVRNIQRIWEAQP